MSDPLPIGRQLEAAIKNNNILLIAMMLLIFGSAMQLFGSQQSFYALADTNSATNVQSPLFDGQNQLFASKATETIEVAVSNENNEKKDEEKSFSKK